MSPLVLAVAALVAVAPGAGAAFSSPSSLAVSPGAEIRASAVDANAGGAVLAASATVSRLSVRDRSAAGELGAPQELLRAGASGVRVALDDAGGALVGASTRNGAVLFERSGDGAFGPAQPFGAAGSQLQALEVDGAGNAALVVQEPVEGQDSRLVLRLRAAGGAFGAPITLADPQTGVRFASGTEVRLAFGAGGRFTIARLVRDENFRGMRIEARSGSVARGLGATRVIARAGSETLSEPSVAVTSSGRVVVAYDVLRNLGRRFAQDVRVAEAAPGGRFSAPRAFSADRASGVRVAAGGDTVAVAWTSKSPRPGRAGVRVVVRRTGGGFGRAQAVSPPERGFGSGGPAPSVRGATESGAFGPQLAVSPRGDVLVSYAFGPNFQPSTVLAAVRLRGARRFDGPQPVSPFGVSAQPLPPAWTRDGAAVAPHASPQSVGVAVRRAGSALAPPQRDRLAPRVRLTEPTLADLRGGVVATRLTCAEACAFTGRSRFNVSNDIAKPRLRSVGVLRAGRSTQVTLPLQESQRARLAQGGARVRAILSFSVVDRFGNSTTARTRICVPRRTPC